MRPSPDKYEDVEYIAQGGMARVYRARRKGSDRIVALREIAGGPGSEQRIESEHRGAEVQRALCAVDPHVPAVYDVFVSDEGWLYVEMEFVPGEDLSDRLRRGALLPGEALRIGIEVFDFLRVAHGNAVGGGGAHRAQVHGDLTPRNIRLTPHGAVKILDFGIAKGLKATVTAQAYANCGYMSPERARSGRMGIADDYWSAGVLFYEMLAGARAFPGSEEEIRAALASRRPPLPLDARIPRPLRLIAARLLAWDVTARYPSAAAALEDLRAAEQGRQTRAEAEADEGRTRPVAPGDVPARAAYAARQSDVTRAVPPAGASDLTRAVLPSSSNSATRPVASPVASPGAAVTPLTPPPLPPPLPGPPPVPARKVGRPQRTSRWRVALVGLIAIIALHELLIWDEVQSRVRAAATEPLDADRWWNDYQDLQDRAWFGQTTAPLTRVLTSRFTTAATATLREFRDDVPDLRLRQYTDARELLAHAAAINPSSATTRAWLENAEGHLARIAGEDRRAEPRADRRRQKLLEAVSRFEEAARLDPRLPDPYLGLARIYTYSIRSPERARQALAAAEDRGHRPGKREHAERGDLLDAEARELYRQARRARGSAEEEPALLRAREHWQTALDEYTEGAGFADADGNARRVSGLIAAIDARLTTIHDEQSSAPPLFEASGFEGDAESPQ